MLASEALDVLGLKPGASRADIKEAYRDLVKVWHPDRLGDDPRLRRKAEEKLKQVNDAYRILCADQGTGGSAAHKPQNPASSTRRPAPPPHSYASAPIPHSARPKLAKIHPGLWFYVLLGMLLLSAAVYAVYLSGPEQTTKQTPASDTSERRLNQHSTSSEQRSGRSPEPTASDAANPDAAPYRVRNLSEAETAQVESACSSLQGLADLTAYQTCMRWQLAAITGSGGRPDLAGLSGEEHESIRSACSEGARLHGPTGYDRCLTSQMAALAAAPARPDLSALSEGDRAGIESACSSAKSRGPATYNRCRIRLVKLLAESK